MQEVNRLVIPLTAYTKVNEPVRCKCAICDYEWDAYPYNLYLGAGCPSCNNSKGENRIKQVLIDNGVETLTAEEISKF